MAAVEDSVLAEELEVLESIYIHELTVERNQSGRPSLLSLDLHPSTGDDLEKRFVCMTLNITPTSQYPNDPPGIEIRNPRGISELDLQRLKEDMVCLAQERQGGPMLFELTELAKECLTESNIPHGPCAICLEDFTEGEPFTKTDCYHHFHQACLTRYILYILKTKDEVEMQQPVGQDQEEDEGVVCPVCRLPISYDRESLRVASEPTKEEGQIKVSPEVKARQEKMAEQFALQKAKGGIIDLDEERNKFLLPANLVITLDSPSDGSTDGSCAGGASLPTERAATKRSQPGKHSAPHSGRSSSGQTRHPPRDYHKRREGGHHNRGPGYYSRGYHRSYEPRNRVNQEWSRGEQLCLNRRHQDNRNRRKQDTCSYEDGTKPEYQRETQESRGRNKNWSNERKDCEEVVKNIERSEDKDERIHRSETNERKMQESHDSDREVERQVTRQKVPYDKYFDSVEDLEIRREDLVSKEISTKLKPESSAQNGENSLENCKSDDHNKPDNSGRDVSHRRRNRGQDHEAGLKTSNANSADIRNKSRDSVNESGSPRERQAVKVHLKTESRKPTGASRKEKVGKPKMKNLDTNDLNEVQSDRNGDNEPQDGHHEKFQSKPLDVCTSADRTLEDIQGADKCDRNVRPASNSHRRGTYRPKFTSYSPHSRKTRENPDTGDMERADPSHLQDKVKAEHNMAGRRGRGRGRGQRSRYPDSYDLSQDNGNSRPAEKRQRNYNDYVSKARPHQPTSNSKSYKYNPSSDRREAIPGNSVPKRPPPGFEGHSPTGDKTSQIRPPPGFGQSS